MEGEQEAVPRKTTSRSEGGREERTGWERRMARSWEEVRGGGVKLGLGIEVGLRRRLKVGVECWGGACWGGDDLLFVFDCSSCTSSC